MVECLYAPNGKYYIAELESKDGRGMWKVKWDDGDSQDRNNHPTSHFKRVISAPPQVNFIHFHDKSLILTARHKTIVASMSTLGNIFFSCGLIDKEKLLLSVTKFLLTNETLITKKENFL